MAVAAHPLTGTFEADRNHSSVVFGVRHLQVSTFRGAFADLEARLVGDESGLRLEGSARVDSISITDPPKLREHVVRSGDFFDAGNHPEILFSSTRGELSSDGGARVEGELTMRGITRPLVATGRFQPPVQDPFGATRAALELRTVLDRRDWGFSWQLPLPDGRDALGWMVEVTAQLELVKQE